jgi:hypothetical protein
MDPMLLTLLYLRDRACCRIRAALDGDRQTGALTLEWIVIAGILVVAAIAAGAFFTGVISKFESKIP